MSDYRIETKCIQSGYQPGNGEPRVLADLPEHDIRIRYQRADGTDCLTWRKSGYFYTRLQNPTNDAVAAKICDLEGGVAAMLTSSGQAANFYAIMNIVEAGDHIVCASALYGGTYNLYCPYRLRRWALMLHLWIRTAPRKSWMQRFRRIQRLYSVRRLPIRRLLYLILKNLPKLHIHMEFHLSWIIHLQLQSTAARLNGERISLHILQQSTWMDMHPASVGRS